ncbi:hypothetical protein F8M41_003134 [Gigaspora margarita]|uniref:Uncharacterized protein n=1 Tax=Gigaspora margarita TaxID=4874 RepID=A0A8H4ES87_GIGMA|nr:hypothetical protein F8M41_003134 [Gigaspora margarita]
MPRSYKYTNYRKRHSKNSTKQLGRKVGILEGKIRNKKTELKYLLAARQNSQTEDKKSSRQIRILPNIIEQMENQLIEKKKKLDDAKMGKELKEMKMQLEEVNKKLEEKNKELEELKKRSEMKSTVNTGEQDQMTLWSHMFNL